jgi:hypothetical protein
VKTIARIPAAIFAVSFLFVGCQLPKGAPHDAPKPAGQQMAAADVRNNCYSLLHQLLDDEKDVGKLRFIKREQLDLRNLVKRIAASSRAAAKRLEEFAKQDPSLVLTNTLLPPGEVATRKAIADTKKKELLGQSGEPFEMSLFLSQAEALSYGSHLAKVAAENDTHPYRKHYLEGLSAELKGLDQQLVSLMLARWRAAPPATAGPVSKP